MDGVILLNKPAGVTSFGALAPLKRALRGVKLGHTGTLDKFADGLLVVLTGAMTRFNPFFSDMDKTYRATFTFGMETDTLDPEGAVIATAPLPSAALLVRRAALFVGAQNQSPPAYSAIHVNGKRASERSRAGETVAIAARPMHIYSLNITPNVNPAGEAISCEALIHCSKGTYVRSLARDLAQAAGSRGYVTALRRESVGQFHLAEATCADNFDPQRDVIAPAEAVKRMAGFSSVVVRDDAAQFVREGRAFQDAWLEASPASDAFLAFDTRNRLLAALYLDETGERRYRFVNGSL